MRISRPYRLDHIFTDATTAREQHIWRVLPEPAPAHKLSDHAPIEVVFQ
jgi:endonuclease/exonuclease/phosphatase family metal-dependent hydrolase